MFVPRVFRFTELMTSVIIYRRDIASRKSARATAGRRACRSSRKNATFSGLWSSYAWLTRRRTVSGGNALARAGEFPISDKALSRARRTVSAVSFALAHLSRLDITACSALAYTNTHGSRNGGAGWRGSSGINRRMRWTRGNERREAS